MADGKRSIGGVLRHPLASVVIGFLLTGVIGTVISQTYQRQNAANELRRTSLAAVRAITHDFYDMRYRRRHLTNILWKGGDPTTVKEAYDAYDEAFFKWSSNYIGHLIQIREFVGAPDRLRLESEIDRRLQSTVLSLHFCTTDAFLAARRAPGDTLDLPTFQCGIGNEMRPFPDMTRLEGQCAIKLFDLIYLYVARDLDVADDDWQSWETFSLENVRRDCARLG